MALAKLNINHKWQMNNARKKVDPVMRKLVDRLDNAYYGTPNPNGSRQPDGWKHGVSQPFFIWDYVVDEDNKYKFNSLSAIIHHLTFLAQHLFNTDEIDKYPEEKYNQSFDNEGNRLMRPDGMTPITIVWDTKQEIKSIAVSYNAAGLTPVLTKARLKNIIDWIKSRPILIELSERRQGAVDGILDPETDADHT